MDRLSENGASVLITSAGDAVVGVDARTGMRFNIPFERVPGEHWGTGDRFCALLLDGLAHKPWVCPRPASHFESAPCSFPFGSVRLCFCCIPLYQIFSRLTIKTKADIISLLRIWWNGRHRGLKIPCRTACGFESRYPHQTCIIRTRFSNSEMGSDFFLSFCRKGITH